MERNGWQRKRIRAVTTLLTLAVMGMIFFFSTQDATRSDQTSGVITRDVINVVHPNYEHYEPARKMSIYNTVQYLVRKCAHYSEYTLLGFMLRLCLESWLGRKLRHRRKLLILFSLLIGACYAGTDEVHQLLIDGRSGQLLDVLLDSCGVFTGTLLGTLTVWGTARLNRRRREGTRHGRLAEQAVSKPAAG